MKVISDDAEISYRVLGDGPTVVLLHPFPAHSELWLPAAELLATRYRVVLPDLRGHGDSGVGNGPATMAKHAADVARVCDDLGIVKAVFGGSSIGGYILFEFWRRFRERIAALMLLTTRPQPDNGPASGARLQSANDAEHYGTAQLVDSMIPKLMGESTRRNRPDLVAVAERMMRKMTPAGFAAVQRGMAARPDSVPTLRTITVPTLLVAGEEDTLTPVGEAQLMQHEIAHSRLQVIPRAGHYAIFEQPQDVARIMRQFLDDLPA